MRPELHFEAFEDRKETIFKWGVEVRGLEKSQRIIGDNASRAIAELLSVYLHKKEKIDDGFQINHAWFKSETAFERFPEFENKRNIIRRMIELERLCERLSYGVPKSVEEIQMGLKLFKELEEAIKRMI